MRITVRCTKCRDDNASIPGELKCSECGTEYVYDKEKDKYFLKHTKCKKCGKTSGTITECRVCDKCGTEYVYDALGASIFYRREGFFPANSKRYWIVRTYYSGFWAKLAGLVLALPLGMVLVVEGKTLLWVGTGSVLLLGSGVCTFLLYRGHAKGGVRGFFGLKTPELSEKGKETKRVVLKG